MKPDMVVLAFVFNDLFHKYLHRPSNNNLLKIDPATYRYRIDPDGLLSACFGWSYFAHTILTEANTSEKQDAPSDILFREAHRFLSRGGKYRGDESTIG